MEAREKLTLNLCCGDIANVGKVLVSPRRNVDDTGVVCPSFSRR